MNKLIRFFCGMLSVCFTSLFFYPLNAQEKIFTIETNVGRMTGVLYPDVPNHARTFTDRAAKGEYDGTLFTRVIKEFIIQGGAPDSRNASAGTRCGFGDRSAEILPEPCANYFHKKGTLAAPRQNQDINPKKKSDLSQFFIVQGKRYRDGELDTLELIRNQSALKAAYAKFYFPVKSELDKLKKENPKEFNRRAAKITAQVDSMVKVTPGTLIFSPEQRAAYTTIGGSPHLDGEYVIYGCLTDGFDVLDKIAAENKDSYDRPKRDIRILRVIIK